MTGNFIYKVGWDPPTPTGQVPHLPVFLDFLMEPDHFHGVSFPYQPPPNEQEAET